MFDALRCAKCATVKPCADFHRASARASGRRSACRECQSAVARAKREAMRKPLDRAPSNLPDEVWLPVEGYERAYAVSNMGRVRSLDREWVQLAPGGTASKHRKRGLVLRPGLATNGYWTVCLGRGNTRTVHSLVAAAFIGECPAGQEVRHKNGNRKDARAANLCYGTRTQNIYDAVDHGTWMSDARIAHCSRLHLYRDGLAKCRK